MLPSTTARVPSHTGDDVNEWIQDRIKENLTYFAEHQERIPERLAQLDREWDIERVLEANAATVAFWPRSLAEAPGM